jgi:hypothetical protein
MQTSFPFKLFPARGLVASEGQQKLVGDGFAEQEVHP